ncbi:hypothetical protein C7417_2989 [Cupriavidus plantarum]|nr:hypothetical protein C7417_2989 [Cupriavidus plantarum]
MPSFTILPLDWTVLGIDGSVAMVNDDNDEAVPWHFARGNPIYALPPDTPKGLVEKRFHDGRRQSGR